MSSWDWNPTGDPYDTDCKKALYATLECARPVEQFRYYYRNGYLNNCTEPYQWLRSCLLVKMKSNEEGKEYLKEKFPKNDYWWDNHVLQPRDMAPYQWRKEE